MSQFLDLLRTGGRSGAEAVPDTSPADRSVLQGREALERRVMALAGRDDDSRPLFVAAFGLDRFDRIRAVIGHAAAAQIVGELAAMLGAAEPDWSVARAADDVLMVAFKASDSLEAERRTEAARLGLQGAHAIGPRQIDIRLAAGLSAAGPPGALLREADVALDAARAARAPFRVFDLESHAAAAGAISLMPELRAAVASGQLFLAHQPQRNLRTGRIEAVESLVRWTHPLHGPVEPTAFVCIAEETGDIAAMTRWVIEHALAEQAELALEGFALPFSVNLSARLVGDDAFIDWILAQALPPKGAFRLEITETAVIDNPEQAFANVARLAAAGLACSIDDYGAGLSSFAYLKRIEADELKLDKSVVDEIGRSRRDALVTRSVIDLAHGLGMRVVAEGVEDGETAAVVAALGCDLGQGFFFGRPAPLRVLLATLQAEAATETPAALEAAGDEGEEPAPRLRSAP